MAEYKGLSLQVFYNSLDISGTGRSVTVTEDAGEPEQIDVTHRGDSERQLLEGFPGSQTVTVEMEILDESGGSASLQAFAVNSKDTLVIYPEGQTNGYIMLTLQNARLTQKTQEVPYDGASTVTASFYAMNSLTHGTYSSA